MPVTYLLADTNPKRPIAQRFGKSLESAMAKRGVGSRTVAASVGAARNSVTNWRRGATLPKVETTRKLAAALDAPVLVNIIRRARTKTCDVCGATFLDETGGWNRRFCSDACRKIMEKGRKGVPVRKRAAVAERRLKAHREAVERMCRECEPDGRCVTDGCPLREVSPLALFESHIDLVPIGRRPAS